MLIPNTQLLFEKIQSLPPDRLVEVDHFVDFLRSRQQEHILSQRAAQVSAPAFAAVWDNLDDEAYDAL